MKIESKRFGTIEVMEDRVLNIKGGLLGFTNMNRFILVDDQEDPNLPFKWLISIDDPEYGFLVTDPGIFFKDYVFDLSEDDRQELAADTEDEVTVITLLTVPSDARKITANLRGPLVFNNRTRVGKQLILVNSGYATKHYIFLGATEEVGAEESTSANTDEASFAAATITSEGSGDKEVKANS